MGNDKTCDNLLTDYTSTNITTTTTGGGDDADSGNNSHVSGDCSLYGYIYRRPIQIPPKSFQEGHKVGSRTLGLIIIFNLALVYHLKAVSSADETMDENRNNTNNNKSVNDDDKNRYIEFALKLYTHVIKCQIKLTRPLFEGGGTNIPSSASLSYSPSFCNMRFNMILYNNMGQIYRSKLALLVSAGITSATPTGGGDNNHNHHKKKSHYQTSYRLCLEQLLSFIMLVVEYRRCSSTITDMTTTATAASQNNNETLSSSSSSSSSPSAAAKIMMDLERFLHNTSPVLMGGAHDQCANAA